MADFLINAGVVFNPKDIDTAAIQKAIAATAAKTAVKLEKFSLKKSALRLAITEALANMSFTLNLKDINVDTGSVKAKLQKVIDEVNRKAVLNPKLNRADTGPNSQFVAKGQDIKATAKAIDDVKRSIYTTNQAMVDMGKGLDVVNNKSVTASQKLALLQNKMELTAKAAQLGKDGLKILSVATTQAGIASAAGARKMSVLIGEARQFQVSAKGVKTAVQQLQGFRELSFMKRGEVERWRNVNSEVSKNTAGINLNREAFEKQSSQLRFNAQAVDGVTKNQNELNRLYAQGGTNLEVFGANLGKILQRFSTYLVSIKLIIAAQQAFNFAVGSIVKFDDAIQDLRKVLTATPGDLSRITKELFEVGRQTGASFEQMAESYNEIVRQGLRAEEGLERLKATMIAVAITELNVTEATNFMTATMKIFGDEVRDEIEVLDVLSKTADESAASATEIAQSFQRSGAAAKAVGVSMRELTALTAATVEQTKISATTIGAAFKTIFSRIVTNTKGIRDQANAWGANITAADSVFEILRKLAGIYGNLDKAQRGQLSYLIAGRRRFTELAGILQSFGDTEELLAKQLESAGTSAGKQAKELEKLSVQATVMTNAYKELIVVLGGFDQGAAGVSGLRDTISDILAFMTSIATTTTSIIRYLNKAGDIAAVWGSIFRGIGKAAIFTVGASIVKQLVIGFGRMVQIGNLFKQVLAGITGQFSVQQKALTGTTLAAERLLNIERKRLATTRSIAKSAEESLRAYARASNAQRRLDAQSSAGANRLRIAVAITAGLQVVTDWTHKFAEGLKTSDSALKRWTGELLDSSASALDFGVTIGLLAGPLYGVIAAAGSLGVSLLALNARLEEAEAAQSKLIREIYGSFISAREAADAGKYVEAAFQETAREGSYSAKSLIVLERALRSATDPISGFGAEIESAKDSLNGIIASVDSAIRAADITRRIAEFTQGFKADVSEFQVRINAGQVEDAFNPVLKQLGEYKSIIQSIDPDVQTIVGEYELLNRAQNALNELGKANGRETKSIISYYQLETEEVLKLNAALEEVEDRVTRQTIALEESIAAIEGIEQIQKGLLKNREELIKQSKEDKNALFQAQKITKDLERNENTLADLKERKLKADEVLNKLASEQSRLLERQTKAYDEAAKRVEELVLSYESISNEITKSNLALQLKSEQLKTIQGQLNDQAKFQIELNKLQQGVSFTRNEEAAIKSLYRKREVAINQIFEQEKNQINQLEQLRAAAEEALEIDRSRKLAEQIEETKRAFEENRVAIFDKITAEIIPEVNATALQAVQRAENALLNARLEFVQQAVQQEEEFARRRIEFIKDFGKETIGRDVLEGELRAVGDFARKTFGDIGALQVKEQEKAARLAIGAIINELQELKKAGVDEGVQLNKAIEARAKVLAVNEELIGRKREIILDRVKESSDDVAESEEKLVASRSKLPELNSQIIQSEKQVATAKTAVTQATDNLRNAYQKAADATGQYRFDLLKASFEIKTSTGSIASAGARIRELSSIYTKVTNEISLSQEKLLSLQKDIADEILGIYQQQFEALKGIGISAATASGEELVKIAEGLNTAAEIVAGADVGSFSAEQIAEALNFSDIYPEIERRIAEFGLERLGIDSSALDDLEGQMLELAKQSAETGKQQVDAAYQQVAVSQQSLANAEEQLSQARDALSIAQQQRDSQLQTVGILQGQYASQRSNHVEVQKHAARQISILDEQLQKQETANVTLVSIDSSIKTLINSIEAQRNTMERLADASSSVPNAAAGSLTPSEARGVLSAARREKRLMPPGSNLMLANTSEVVLTNRQASMMGLAPIPKKFAAAGNAQTTGLENAAATLSTTMNALLNKLNSPGFVQQNISVQVDSQRKIQVTGLDAIEKTVKRATEERFGSFASKEEQDAINDTVVSIVGKLQEMGVVNSIGE